MESSLDDGIISNLTKYINSNFSIEINSLDELMQYDLLVKDYVDNIIASGDLYQLHNTISLLLFNKNSGDVYDFQRNVAGPHRLKSLAKKINDPIISETLSGYSVLVKFYKDNVAAKDNVKYLRGICDKLNSMPYEDRASFLKAYEDIEEFVKYSYGLERYLVNMVLLQKRVSLRPYIIR